MTGAHARETPVLAGDIRDCPVCHAFDGKITETRTRDGYIYRRRRCGKCGVRWTTREMFWSMKPVPREGETNARSDSKG